jgi:hypothetical protein
MKKNIVIASISIALLTSLYIGFSSKKNKDEMEKYSDKQYKNSEIEVGREQKNLQLTPDNNISNNNLNTTTSSTNSNNFTEYKTEEERLRALQPSEEELNKINNESEKYKEHLSVEDTKGETPILAPEMH